MARVTREEQKELFPGANELIATARGMVEKVKNSITDDDLNKIKETLKTAFEAGKDAAEKGVQDLTHKIEELKKD